MFLLPGGLPLFFGVVSAIQFGGRPGPRKRPRARRSRLPIASPICSRSAFSSARILATSITISLPPTPALLPAGIETAKEPCFRRPCTLRFSPKFAKITRHKFKFVFLFLLPVVPETLVSTRWPRLSFASPSFPVIVKRKSDGHQSKTHGRLARTLQCR